MTDPTSPATVAEPEADARRAALHWDVSRQPLTLSRWLRRSWKVKLALLAAAGGVAVLVVPLVIAGGRFANKLTHPLEDLARQAQPPSAQVFDSGVKDNNPNSTGFAFGISAQSPAVLLAAPPPTRWAGGPESGGSPDSRFYRSGRYVLTVRVDPCRLQRCKPGDSLVYTEVMDVG